MLDPIEDKFLSQRPKAEIDPKFRSTLKAQLINEIKPIKINFMNKFKYAIAAGLAIIVVAVVVVAAPKKKGEVALLGTPQITKLSANAFGHLNTGNVNVPSGMGGGGNNTTSLSAPSTATPESTKMSTEPAVGMGGGGMGVAVGRDALIYNPINYKFVYTGEKFTVDEDSLPVYERQKGFGTANLSTILSNFNVSMFNIGKFANARLDYLTASQDVDKGYMLSLDMREGLVSIGQNYEKWYAPNQVYQPLSPNQLPADDAVINVANSFLDEYGIDRSGFGSPVVQNNWKIQYAAATDKSLAYVPDQIAVVYPTKLEGNEAYDQSGNKTGMMVSVDVRANKVAYVSELTSQRYSASDYETEKDVDRILGLAQKGGYQTYYPIDQADAKTVEVDLGTPTKAYVRLWLTKDNKTSDLYVPSLIFPVINQPKDVYVTNVIVPIAKEVLDTEQNSVPPMILEKSAR